MSNCPMCGKKTNPVLLSIGDKGYLGCPRCNAKTAGEGLSVDMKHNLWIVSRIIDGKRVEFVSKERQKAIELADMATKHLQEQAA